MQLQSALGPPDWDGGREQRLLVSMLLATLIVATALSLLRWPRATEWAPVVAPIVSLWVRLVDDRPIAAATVETAPADAVDAEPMPPEPEPGAGRSGRSSARTAAGTRNAEVAPPRDWSTATDEAIEQYLDGLENPYVVNPLMAKKRREFAGRYQPPVHGTPKPVWENAEKDQLGRTVLRSGNCYRVIDDPNVGSRDTFLEFGQYITMCTLQLRKPRELPWVDEIRQRYLYLKYPDGYVPEEADE